MEKEEFTRALALRIIKIAKENFGTKRKLADSIKINENTIRRWETGENTPDLYTLYKICKVANISLDYLVLGKGFEEDSLDLDLFDEVFEYAYKLAIKENLPFNGSYFLGVYGLVNGELKKGSKLSVKELVESHKKQIIRLRKM